MLVNKYSVLIINHYMSLSKRLNLRLVAFITIISLFAFSINSFSQTIYFYRGGSGGCYAINAYSPTPQSPNIISYISGHGQVSINCSPGIEGESQITNYEFSIDNGSTWITSNPSITSSPIIITGLTNGTSYPIKIRAVNSYGSGLSSSVINAIAGLPSPPTNLTATPSNGQVSLSFTEGSNGGSAITNYEYAINGGTFTSCNPVDNTSPIVISGLTNGTQYTFQLRAVNAIGSGTSSGSITAIPIATAPSSPTNLSVTPGNGELFIHYTAGSDGGSAITNYMYSIDNGATWTTSNPAVAMTPVPVKYLTNGTAYSVVLKAVNSIGESVSSATITGTPSLTYLTSVGTVTVVSSGGDAEGSTWFYANNTIMPKSSTAVNLNVSDLLSKLSTANLTVAGSNININTSIVDNTNRKLIFNSPGTINVAANLTTAAPIIYNGVVVTSGARSITASKIWVNGTLTGDNNITLNAKAGNVVLMSNVLTTGVFSATASSTFAMGVDLINGLGATITADGGVHVTANASLLAGKVLTNNAAINISGNIQVAHFAATAAPLLFDARNGAINLTNGAVTAITGESVDYALLVANAAKAVTESNVTISKVVSGTDRYLVYQFTTVGSDLFFTPYQITSSEYLVVAGGGGGGGSVPGVYAGGGGGGGGVANGTATLSAGLIKSIEVGAGGAIGANQNGATPPSDGTNGSNSFLDNILAGGGGGAGASSDLITNTGRNGLNGNGGLFYTAGGGGGGVGSNSSATAGVGGIGSQRSGGAGAGKSLNEPGSGGPGGGAVGNASRGYDNAATSSGAGYVSTITGTSVEYGKGSITYLYSRYSTLPGAGGAALSNYYGYSGAASDGAVILRHLVGNETNYISTKGINIGNTGNTGNVTNTSSVNIAGPISLEGTNLNINATLTSTNSDIHLYAINAASQSAALTANGLGLHGTGVFTLTNTSNNVINFAAGEVSSQPAAISFTDASGGLVIGTVGTLTGTVSVGNIFIETLTGNLTVSKNMQTASTSPDAVILNAAKNESIGTLTGGNILVTGSSTITTGNGGIVKLFSGDPTTSNGLVNLVGGVGNAYFLVDETTSSFSPNLVSGNKYALFRGNPPVVSVTGTLNTFTACVGSASDVKTLTVAGNNLTADIVVTVSAGYELSVSSNSGFTNSITLTNNNGTVSNTTIYVRLKSDASNGDFGNLEATSTGASTQYKGINYATIGAYPAAPIANATINYTTGDTPIALTATALTNHTLNWYANASGGTATTTAFTPSTNVAGTQNYYVSQISAIGCESARTSIAVIVTDPVNQLQAPAGLSYSSINNVYTDGTAITAITPVSTGGAIATYAISPGLPTGLTLNASTGVISGTPSGTSSQTTFTITATNATGSTTATITIQVDAPVVNIAAPAGLSYSSINNVYTDGTAITAITPVSTGGAIASYAISPSLPTGLTLNASTGVISGTPSGTSSQTTFTITATNATGSTTTTITIQVDAPLVNIAAPAGLSYSSINNVYTDGTSITAITPVSTGGAIANYAISPSLPTGLTLNASTGVISGTPSGTSSQTTFTITATNATGSTTATITIQVDAPVVIILPQGFLDAIDNGLLASDTVKLKLTISSGIAPFTLILSNNYSTLKDTIINLNPINNEVVFQQKILDTSKVFKIEKLIDANNLERTSDFTKDTAVVHLLRPLLVMNLISETPLLQSDGSYNLRLKLTIKNLGDVVLNNVQVDANLNNVFGSNYTYDLTSVNVFTGTARLNPNYTGLGPSNVSNADAIVSLLGQQSEINSNGFKRVNNVLSENYLFDAGTILKKNEENFVQFDLKIRPIANAVPLSLQFASTASALLEKSDGTISKQATIASSNNATNIDSHPNVTGVGVPLATFIAFPPKSPVVSNKRTYIIENRNPINLSSLITSKPDGAIVYWCTSTTNGCNTNAPNFPINKGKYSYSIKSYDTTYKLFSEVVNFEIELISVTDIIELKQVIGTSILQENLTYNVPVTISLTNMTNYIIDSLFLINDLKSILPFGVDFKVLDIQVNGNLVANTGYNGNSITNLTTYLSSLSSKSTATVSFILNINPKGYSGLVNIQSRVNAVTKLGSIQLVSELNAIELPFVGIQIPEVFTPNRDGVNDRFVITKPYGLRVDLEVYNRWGTIVFTSNDYKNDWDGRGNNSFLGQDLVDGGYYYTVKLKNQNGSTQILKGFIIIQR